MTLSRITLRGHGAASDIAVSTSIASNMMMSQPRYGLSSSATSCILPLVRVSTAWSGAAVEGTVAVIFIHALISLERISSSARHNGVVQGQNVVTMAASINNNNKASHTRQPESQGQGKSGKGRRLGDSKHL